jgi:hypothetical protein
MKSEKWEEKGTKEKKILKWNQNVTKENRDVRWINFFMTQPQRKKNVVKKLCLVLDLKYEQLLGYLMNLFQQCSVPSVILSRFTKISSWVQTPKLIGDNTLFLHF